MEGIGGKFGQAGLLDIIALPYLIGKSLFEGGGDKAAPRKSLAPTDGGAQPKSTGAPQDALVRAIAAMSAPPQQSQPMISNAGAGSPLQVGRTQPQARPPTPPGMQPFISQGMGGGLQLGNYSPEQIDAAQRLRTLLMMSGALQPPR